MKKIFTLLVLMVLSVLGASAQGTIERAVAKIEKQKSTQYVAYSENRNPDTHRVYKASKVLVIDDAAAKQFKDAFNRDRSKAVSMQMAHDRMFEVTFAKGNERSCYTLVRQRNGSWLLTVEVKNADNAPGRRRNTAGEVPASQATIVWQL